MIEDDQKVSVHMMNTIQSLGAQRLFDHPVLMTTNNLASNIEIPSATFFRREHRFLPVFKRLPRWGTWLHLLCPLHVCSVLQKPDDSVCKLLFFK